MLSESIKRFKIEIFAGMIFVLLGLFGLLFLGEKVTLDCYRSQNICQLATFHFSGTETKPIPLKDLQGAKIQQTVNQKKKRITYIYRVMLSTAKGYIPLTESFTSGKEQPYKIARKINQFINNPQQKTLNIQLDHLWVGYIFGGLFGIFGLVVLFLSR